jgi:hypothetical protein
MTGKKVSITPEGELRIKVGRHFCMDEAVHCMRDCRIHPVGNKRRVIFDLLGTQSIETAGLGFMLMVKERCGLTKDNAVILYDHPGIDQILSLAHFGEQFHLVRHGKGFPGLGREGEKTIGVLAGEG